MPVGTPIVFVVDDDVSVRESLELLITTDGWQPDATNVRHRTRLKVHAILHHLIPKCPHADLFSRARRGW